MTDDVPNPGARAHLGPYLLKRLISRGSSDLYEADDLRTGQTVALRLLRRANPALRERFHRIAPLVESTRHPHLVPVHECGELDGVPYLDAWFVDEPSLDDVIGRGSISVERVVAIVSAVAEALDALHGAGLVHGDVTLRTIFVGTADYAYLAAFGFADLNVTRADLGADDAEYVAPERLTDGDVTRAADVYALAQVLRKCLPNACTPAEGLEAVIALATSPDPTARYASAGKFASAARAAVSTASPERQVPQDESPIGAAPGSAPPDRALPFHDDVQFTVYRPKVVRPLQSTPLLAFAHLGEAPLGADPHDDPIEQVKGRARAVLGDRFGTFAQMTQDSSIGLPEESAVTFVLDIPDFDVKGPNRTFLWVNAVHMEEFQIRPSATARVGTARGRLLVMHGSILLAEVRLAIAVDPEAPPVTQLSEMPSTATAFRKIFPSYSHADTSIVMQFERYMESLGDRYLRDVYTLRAGEQWSSRLCDLIREADVFQLFWSHNSMISRFVEDEWRYALSLNRSDFIRPTYWEQPMPTGPGLPPADLGRLHFHALGQRADAGLHQGHRPAPSATVGDAPRPPTNQAPPPPFPDPPQAFGTHPPGASGPPPPVAYGAAPPVAYGAPPPVGYGAPPAAYGPTPPTSRPPARPRARGSWQLAGGLAGGALVAAVGVIGIQTTVNTTSSLSTSAATSTRTMFTSSPTASPGSQSPTASPSTTALRPTAGYPIEPSQISGLSDAEILLVELLPADYSTGSCKPIPPIADALATVDCTRTATPGGPDLARYTLFADAQTANRHFKSAINEDSALLPCPGTTVPSPSDWTDGRVACGRYEGRASITWTRAGEAMVADAQSEVMLSLYEWWRRFR